MKSRTWFSDRRASSAIAEGGYKGFSSAIGRALAFAGHARLTQLHRVFLRVGKGVLGVEQALLSDSRRPTRTTITCPQNGIWRSFNFDQGGGLFLEMGPIALAQTVKFGICPSTAKTPLLTGHPRGRRSGGPSSLAPGAN